MTKSDIEKSARQSESETCEWSDIRDLFDDDDPAQNAYVWANENMMWVEFHYDENKREILKVTFGSSK